MSPPRKGIITWFFGVVVTALLILLVILTFQINRANRKLDVLYSEIRKRNSLTITDESPEEFIRQLGTEDGSTGLDFKQAVSVPETELKGTETKQIIFTDVAFSASELAKATNYKEEEILLFIKKLAQWESLPKSEKQGVKADIEAFALKLLPQIIDIEKSQRSESGK